jgi:hypothetical protein
MVRAPAGDARLAGGRMGVAGQSASRCVVQSVLWRAAVQWAPPPHGHETQHAHTTERRVYAVRSRTIRVAHTAPVRVYYPHPFYAAASPPPPPYPRVVYPGYRTWQAVYPVYAYPGYGYVYYYVYPYGYRAY